MEILLWVIPAAVGILGLVLLVGGGIYMFRGRLFKGGRGMFGGLVLVGVALIVGLVALNIQTYARLTYERPIAIIKSVRVGPQQYEVTLCQQGAVPTKYMASTATPHVTRPLRMHADQWRLEAYVLKWKPWANIVGLDSTYLLDRLGYRFKRNEQERTAPLPRDSYELRDDTDPTPPEQLLERGINLQALPAMFASLSPARDADYGSGVFKDMGAGGVHIVWLTQDALIARDGDEQDFVNCRDNRQMPDLRPPPADPRAGDALVKKS